MCPHLVIVEHAVCDGVPSDDSGRPQLLHEEHLVCEVVGRGVVGWTGTLEPFCQVAHKVKEEVALRHTDHWGGRRSGWVRLVLAISPISPPSLSHKSIHPFPSISPLPPQPPPYPLNLPPTHSISPYPLIHSLSPQSHPSPPISPLPSQSHPSLPHLCPVS